MSKKTKTERKGVVPRSNAILSLLVETDDQSNRNVDAEHFFSVAENWLRALQAFASERGEKVTWEIVALQKSSALVKVRPVAVKTRKPIPELARNWDAGVREIKKTGKAPKFFPMTALGALDDFVRALPQNVVVSINTGASKAAVPIDAETQGRVREALDLAATAVPREYSVRGTLRGRLATLNSWNPTERTFRLQLPLSPAKPVICVYRDERLVRELGAGFEGTVEVSGVLHYRREEPWPSRAEVDGINVLPSHPAVLLADLINLLPLPKGQDSVSYVRSLRDA
jgi:hypothetical protein